MLHKTSYLIFSNRLYKIGSAYKNVGIEDEKKLVKQFLANRKIKEHVVKYLTSSLQSIGYSAQTIKELIDLLTTMQIKKFQDKNYAELKAVHSIEFFQKIVPKYFENYIVPYIPPSNKLLDIGCGTGILAYVLSKSDRFKQILGIDIDEYLEWKKFNNKKIKFQIINQNNFGQFLAENKPDTIIMTWTLHHMSYEEQESYLKNIYDILPKVRIVILEDAYAATISPIKDIGVYDSFMMFNEKDRAKIMSVYDWIANRVLERRDKIPIPFAYRTLEEWRMFFEKIGFKIISEKFIGFPEKRDINTPQSLLVIEKWI